MAHAGSLKVRGCDVVAVLPAAGRSRRLAPLPCSKEILPVGFGAVPGCDGIRPRVVSHYLFECLQQGGVHKGYVVIRQGKWDIPAYWGDGSRIGMDLAYVAIEDSCGPPDTIDRAYSFLRNNIVAFGFPDIIFQPTDAFAKLLTRLSRRSVDVVLGLFPAHDSKSMDMVDIGANGRVRAVQLKPRRSKLEYTWVCAVWTPVFTEFLHEFLKSLRRQPRARMLGNCRIDSGGDIPVGAVIRSAIRAGLHVEGVTFPTGRYTDIGTPQALAEVSRIITGPSVS